MPRLFLISLLFWLAAMPAYSCTLRMGADSYFPPHLNPGEQGWQGLSIDLARSLATEVGCELTILQSPWRRSLQLLAQGQLDILSHLSFSEARHADFRFIGPHHIETVILIGDAAKLPKLESLTELAEWPKERIIAILNGAYYGEAFQQLIEQDGFGPTLVEIRSHEDKLALLESGRVDAVLEDQTTLYHWQQSGQVQHNQYQQLLVVYQNPVYFGISRQSIAEAQAIQLDEAWQRLYQQGRLQQIRARYLPTLPLPEPAAIH
ncbi:transporter substrate-binding domain-containing protein [Alkalimonas delamerensis]|uniref:Transporter substrate-binding domain-containing protein n=1 Tax=Alkalimonas delamerensis TaxID=265981 RepID=A0ABT9GQV0_9GAMM|nr:transporter substrate-binding domain-containing protein [Alkalimonas delamerensis]MDP4529348.1 transporter substrate-binding domain-containing protein [Alkalimonas delamerensis]